MSEGPLRLGVAAEHRSDVRRVTGLLDRLIVDEVNWIELELLDDYRVWSGLQGEDFLEIKQATRRARAQGLKIHGMFGGEPGAADAQMHRAALVLFAEERAAPALVLLVRDLDDDPDRARGFQQARDTGSWGFQVIGALCAPEIEAWLIAAWDPENEEETEILSGLRQDLGFDPRRDSRRLSSKSETDRKDCKRVLTALTRAGRPAEERWHAVPFSLLFERGAENGVSALLTEARERLLPLFDPRPRR